VAIGNPNNLQLQASTSSSSFLSLAFIWSLLQATNNLKREKKMLQAMDQ